MQVSPDGTVPPHLLERLRQLETPRRSPAPQESAATITGPTSTSVSGPGPAGSRSPSRRRGGRKEAAPRRDQGAWALYDEFLQRLEEEDGERG
jgi:hypothetical protein